MTPSGSGNDSHRKRRWPTYVLSSKVGLPLAALLLAVSGIMAYRESRLRGLPDIGHPFDLEEFYAIDVPAEENAWPDYEAAFSLAIPAPPSGHQEVDTTLDQGWHMATPFVRQWLEDNRPALQRWRSGTEKAACLRVHPREISIESIILPYSESETLLHLSRLEALREEAEGEAWRAWGWHRALFRFSRHRGMYDMVIERQIGMGCHACLLQPIARWAAHQSLTAEELQAAFADVRDAFRLTAPQSIGLKYHYLYECDAMNHLNEWHEWFDGLAHLDAGLTIPSAAELYVTNQPEIMRRLLQHQIANVLPHCDKLPRDRPPSASDVLYFRTVAATDHRLLPSAQFMERVDRFPVSKIVLARSWRAADYLREQAFQAALEVTLAAEWYRRVHGKLPEDLSQLVAAGMLPDVPDDPWSPIPAPLRYERDPANPSRAKVWSVGQNGVDDGGEIAPDDYDVGDLGLWIGGEPDSE